MLLDSELWSDTGDMHSDDSEYSYDLDQQANDRDEHCHVRAGLDVDIGSRDAADMLLLDLDTDHDSPMTVSPDDSKQHGSLTTAVLPIDALESADCSPAADTQPIPKRILGVVFLLAMWKTTFNINRTPYNFLLRIVSILFDMWVQHDNQTRAPGQAPKQQTPLTAYRIDTAVDVDPNDFERRAVCTSYNCWKTYGNHAACTVRNNDGSIESVKCTNNKGKGGSKDAGICGADIGCEVKVGGESKFVARHVMCYNSLLTLFCRFFKRPGIADVLKSHAVRLTSTGVLTDVYDGTLWQTFWRDYGQPFEAQNQPHPSGRSYTRVFIGMALNVDWFQPFKHVQYSVGVVYWTILNLPRHLRYLPGNVFITHILPTGSEKGVNMNNVLKESVLHLLRLWQPAGHGDGFAFTDSTGALILICVALMIISCDQPAARKLTGFVAVGGLQSCTKCNKTMSRIQSDLNPLIRKGKRAGDPNMKTCCAGFADADVKKWKGVEARTHNQHKKDGTRWKDAPNKSQRESITRETGSRFTVFSALEYLDLIKSLAIDPMHLIFMGTAKKIVKYFKSRGFFPDRILVKLQRQIDQCKLPRDVSGLRYKVGAGFSHVTADQWKVFWTVFAETLFTAENLEQDSANFTDRMRRLVCVFAKVARLSSTSIITTSQISLLGGYLLETSRLFEEVFGKAAISINQHMQCHLADCITLLGPTTAFNLFAMERMNGILGHVPTNVYAYEVCVMRQLTRLWSLSTKPESTGGTMQLDTKAEELFADLTAAWTGTAADGRNQSLRVAFQQVPISALSGLQTLIRPAHAPLADYWPLPFTGNEPSLAFLCKPVECQLLTLHKGTVEKWLGAYMRKLMNMEPSANDHMDDDIDNDIDDEPVLPLFVQVAKTMTILGQTFGTATDRSINAAQCLVSHGYEGQTISTPAGDGIPAGTGVVPYPAQIQLFLQFSVDAKDDMRKCVRALKAFDFREGDTTFTFAVVSWYKVQWLSQNDAKHRLSDTALTHAHTYANKFAEAGWSSLVPVSAIVSRFVKFPVGTAADGSVRAFRPLPLPRRVYMSA
jgi:hypothetical protein